MSDESSSGPGTAGVDGAEADGVATGPDADGEPRAADGRVPGRRGRATRQRLLECTAEMLRTTSYRDLKVVDIAREAGTSPATFYQYFADVEDAILCLAGELVEQVPQFASQIDAGWIGDDGLDRARALVASYTRFWDEHGAVLRVMHLRADELEPRFRRVRNEYNGRFMSVMVRCVEEAREAGRMPPSMDPDATAGAMLTVLDRLPSYRESFERRGTSREEMVETVARILHAGLTGRMPT
jgi:AcrR family transcriptional regulator